MRPIRVPSPIPPGAETVEGTVALKYKNGNDFDVGNSHLPRAPLVFQVEADDGTLVRVVEPHMLLLRGTTYGTVEPGDRVTIWKQGVWTYAAPAALAHGYEADVRTGKAVPA